MEGINKLLKKRDQIEFKIKELKLALDSASAQTNNGKFKIGTHYHMTEFHFDDKEIICLIEGKITNLEIKLKPIVDRLEILNELACEVLKDK